MTTRHGCQTTRRHWLALCLLAMAACSGAGCTVLTAPGRLLHEYCEYNEHCDGMYLGWRNHVFACQAWHAQVGQCGDHPYQCDLGRGFRQGYRDVASGGCICPPTFPPRRYWSWRYQSPEGQAKVAAWFEGYPLGAAAAQRDGLADWSRIQISYAAEATHAAHAAAQRYRSWRPDEPAAEQLDTPLPNPVLPELDPTIDPQEQLRGIPMPTDEASARRQKPQPTKAAAHPAAAPLIALAQYQDAPQTRPLPPTDARRPLPSINSSRPRMLPTSPKRPAMATDVGP